ncbi:MAG TPA: ATP phosphoribosyltransferase [Chloroflexota bacterium]|jgi:ATP phosphoribosyltransferase|nr:ATP phosphoribosyltransferase [Chloroflexota bacterium]
MTSVNDGKLRLALPSKGRPYEATLSFLADCGLPVSRPNPRQYVAGIPALANVTVVFDHSREIPEKLRDGSVDVGITGTDSLYESGEEDDERAAVISYDLRFMQAQLVLAVPDAWIDVWTIHDLADLSVRFRDRNRTLRLASDSPNLTRRFLHRQGIYYADVIEQPGAVESAPMMGYADAISVLTSTGTSLRENRLKTLVGGTVLEAAQCLVANLETLRRQREKVAPLARILELIEARQQAHDLVSVVANVRGPSAEAVAAHVWARPELAGLQGPTVAPVYGQAGTDGTWYAVTVVVPTTSLLAAVEHFRESGGTGITAIPAHYVFGSTCRAYEALAQRLRPSEPAQK